MSISTRVFRLVFGVNDIGTKNEVGRDEWVRKALMRVPTGSRILDAGAGEQRYRKYCNHLEYISQDFAEYDGAGNKIGLQTGTWDCERIDIVSDITSIPEPDESFDAILCTEVLEHLPSPISAIGEFSRLLRTGGVLILTAPFASLTHFAPYYFYTGFSRFFYETHLPNYGFKIMDFSENGNYFEYLAQEIRRVSSVSDAYAHKRPNKLEKLAIQIVLKMLSKFSNFGSQSSQLAHFGEHLLAERTKR